MHSPEEFRRGRDHKRGGGAWQVVKDFGIPAYAAGDIASKVGIGGGSLAGGGGSSGGGATVGGNSGHTGSEVVHAAQSKIGDPYVWGATGPNSFDCSGLTQWAYKQIGINIPRTASQQSGAGKPVDRSNLQLGDLIFYNYGRLKGTADHVGIYAGNGKQIDAPTAGKNVETAGIDWKHFIGARRFLGAAGTMTGTGDDKGSQQQGDSGPGQNAGARTVGYSSTSELEAVMAGLSGGFGGVGNSTTQKPSSPAGTDSGAAGGTSAPAGPSNPTGNAAIVKSMAAGRGWTGSQWDALNQLVTHESHFNNLAQNPHSTAYGMFQFLDSTWGPHAKTSDPRLQTQYGLDYISRRYKDPMGAWAFWQKHHWYDQGAWEIKGDQVIQAHDGEMVINKQKSKSIRDALLAEVNPSHGSSGAGGLTISVGNISVTVTGQMNEDAATAAARQVVDKIAEDDRIRKIMAGV